jgi:uncharacterized protein YbjT (DUF2867 family)
VVVRALADGQAVRVMSRRPAGSAEHGLERAAADLATGKGLAEAVAGVDTIVHAASSPFSNSRAVDVHGTVRLLAQARAAGVSHFLYISIVGIEDIPLDYYQNKLAAEAAVRQGGIPWTILRATQFHTLIDRMLAPLRRLPLALLSTDFRFQPIDPGLVADRLLAAVESGPSGRLHDVGGPEIRTLGDLAAAWLRAKGLRRLVLPLPMPGRVAAAFRAGYNTNPAASVPGPTWEEWLRPRDAGGRLTGRAEEAPTG